LGILDDNFIDDDEASEQEVSICRLSVCLSFSFVCWFCLCVCLYVYLSVCPVSYPCSGVAQTQEIRVIRKKRRFGKSFVSVFSICCLCLSVCLSSHSALLLGGSQRGGGRARPAPTGRSRVKKEVKDRESLREREEEEQKRRNELTSHHLSFSSSCTHRVTFCSMHQFSAHSLLMPLLRNHRLICRSIWSKV